MKIDLGGLGGLVAQPKCDDGVIDTVLQKIHRRGVAKHMRGDLLVLERWAAWPGGCGVLGDQSFDCVAAEETPAKEETTPADDEPQDEVIEALEDAAAVVHEADMIEDTVSAEQVVPVEEDEPETPEKPADE